MYWLSALTNLSLHYSVFFNYKRHIPYFISENSEVLFSHQNNLYSPTATVKGNQEVSPTSQITFILSGCPSPIHNKGSFSILFQNDSDILKIIFHLAHTTWLQDFKSLKTTEYDKFIYCHPIFMYTEYICLGLCLNFPLNKASHWRSSGNTNPKYVNLVY